ncbi:hypothetical protein [Rahnella contaminans]|uniref:hypothetical protein n=1 Tax=Rahnella contaminans TaxID=2703882 RepID=UPI0023DC69AF|nr:hypothetical protein [Rahnella contaminans]MDF1896702.1 hypothetical protein [Rahnella contaminans]
MHTHNVNSKTATTTPPERWGAKSTSLRTDGFIRDISSSHPFDVIRADVVISRLSEKAHQGCGRLHIEIYGYNLIVSAMAHLKCLPEKDHPAFLQAAEKQGLTLTDEALVCSANAYCDLRNQLFVED